MIVGAWLLIQYLVYRDPGVKPSLRGIDDFLFGAYWVAMLVGTYLQPTEDRTDAGSMEPSPRWSGTFVVLATGGAAAVIIWNTGAGGGFWTPAIIALGTVIAAMVVWRFATQHAKEIGEARFLK
jgi:hypothetical protein